MSKKSVTVMLAGRVASTRCHRKIIKPFTNIGESLFELTCKRMKELKHPYAVGVGDQELIDIANKYEVPIFHRTKEEVTTAKFVKDVFKCVEQCETTHAMIISPCTPFLSMETVNQACDYLCNTDGVNAMSSILKEQNWYFNRDKILYEPIDLKMKSSNDLCVYAMACAFEAFPIDRFLRDGIYYTFENKEDPYLYEIPKSQAVDINDDEDFKLASYRWNHENGL